MQTLKRFKYDIFLFFRIFSIAYLFTVCDVHVLHTMWMDIYNHILYYHRALIFGVNNKL